MVSQTALDKVSGSQNRQKDVKVGRSLSDGREAWTETGGEKDTKPSENVIKTELIKERLER